MPDAIDATPRPAAASALAERIDAALPQTQCTKCGFPGCRPYAEAVAAGSAEINRCPPGGAAGIAKLSLISGRPPLPLNPANGVEGPLRRAVIDEALCIGCTLCIQACPVDAIVGAPKVMHAVLASVCTGCDLCVPPCPMDCIALIEVVPRRRWSDDDARAARGAFEQRNLRLARERIEVEERRLAKAIAKLHELETRTDADDGQAVARKARVAAAIERARARHRQSPSTATGRPGQETNG
ncbi:MAG TPA: electron transport complex subunit RsxB [Burkholderiaceae bacterium]|nr:electron transport complex subunit RsxB [Burkholderiaceae bacterium]